MPDLTNEEILADDPNSFSVEAEENVYYTPQPSEDAGVVVTEPDIILIGRAKRREALRDMPKE